jgi:hypothetical protein
LPKAADENTKWIRKVLRRRRVYFVYSEEHKHAGSTIMRGAQLATLAKQSLGTYAHVRVAPLTDDFRNGMLFLTKGALKTASAERLATLKEQGNRLYFDVVDEHPPPTTNSFADVLVCASLTAFADLSREFPHVEAVLLNHHVDPRVHGPDSTQRNEFRAGYFGETINALLTPRIEEAVDVTPIDTSREDSAWIRRLPGYSAHYAVRRTRELDRHKPFLKGFTAAHCNANILIQRSETEAVAWLGNDYPYLIDDPVTESHVLEALEQARASYGSQQWAAGLETMAGIRDRTSRERIGSELRRLFR